jgi:hypothetical protein
MSEAFNSSNDDCRLVKLPRIHNRAGNITVINQGAELPFSPERSYYLYDVPGGESRGGHAHKSLQQYLVAGSGSFDVVLSDGKQRKKINLNRPDTALHIVPGIWREIENFSSGSICLVIASEKYDESDYIRNYKEFLATKK